MSYSLVDMVLKSSVTDPTEVAVLVALASFADKYCSCYPSVQSLCDRSRYKERAVQGAVRRLEERGILSVKIGRGRGGANFYTLHPSTLKPAADAPISDPKTRSKCTPKEAENPHLTTLKPASDDIKPAADAPESVNEPIKEPKSCASARETGPEVGRVLRMRSALIEAMGLTGSELNTSGTFIVQKMSPADLELSLAVWSKDGLTDDQIIAAVRSKIQSEQSKNPSFIPRSAGFFDGPIEDHALRLKRPSSTRIADTQAETPEQRQRRYRKMIGG